MATEILLVRHGQTIWNQEGRFRGRADVALDEVGMAQADIVARWIAEQWKPAAVYCSPLRRARQTAEAIAQPLRLHDRPHAGLLDIDYGAWQGLTVEEVRERWSSAVDAWFTNPTKAAIPGGENLSVVQLRVVGTMREIVNRHREQVIVVVAHTVVNRLILLAMLHLPLERFWYLGQDVGAINHIRAVENDFVLVSMNERGHLRALEGEDGE